MRATGWLFTVALALIPISAPAQEAEIATAITGQLDAFTHRDAARAFGYASPTIKGLFGTSDNFAAMVQTGYPMVWTPGAAEMLGLRQVAGALWQRVHITDAQGRGWMLDYQMIQTADGWKINAVELLPGTDLGT